MEVDFRYAVELIAKLTRMHSSRMRTGRSLTVFRRLLLRGGCTWSWGGVVRGGVPGPGGAVVRGVPGHGGVPGPGGCLVRYSPPCEQNE